MAATLQCGGHQAGALIGTGRTAIRIGRRRDHDASPVGQCSEAIAQAGDLRAAEPAMGHRIAVAGIESFDSIPAHRHARCNDDAIGAMRAVLRGAYLALDRIDRDDLVDQHTDAVRHCDIARVPRGHRDLIEAGDHAIAEWPGQEPRLSLDQQDVGVGQVKTQHSCAAGAAESSADDDDPRASHAGRPGACGQQQCGRQQLSTAQRDAHGADRPSSAANCCIV